MALIVPRKVMVVSFVPSPAVNVSPASAASVSLPWLAVSVSCTGFTPASGSLMLIVLELAAEKTRSTSSVAGCVAGLDDRWTILPRRHREIELRGGVIEFGG